MDFGNYKVPVISAIHGVCYGAALDLITSTDVRMCSEDSKFSIKEVDVGFCSDIGVIQRIVHLVGNDSIVRELTYSGRIFNS